MVDLQPQRAREGDGMQKPWSEQETSSLLYLRWGATVGGRGLGVPSPDILHGLDVGHPLSVALPLS